MKRTTILTANIALSAAAFAAVGCATAVRDFEDQDQDGSTTSSTTSVSSASGSGGAGGSGGSGGAGGAGGGATACDPGLVEPCYSGPSGTQNVGVCIAGTSACDATGVFGPCEGEITPAPEACNGVDDDCNGAVDDGVNCFCAVGGVALNFEDALGMVGDADQVPAPGSAKVSGVTFTSVNGEPVYNIGKDFGDNPFSSDWFMIWTFGTGGTIEFPAPITSLKMEVGADNAVAETGTFDIIVADTVLLTVTLSKMSTVPVDLKFPPATQVRVVFKSGSVSLFGFDNLHYVCDEPAS